MDDCGSNCSEAPCKAFFFLNYHSSEDSNMELEEGFASQHDDPRSSEKASDRCLENSSAAETTHHISTKRVTSLLCKKWDVWQKGVWTCHGSKFLLV